MSRDARWWDDSPAGYEIRLAMGTVIVDIDPVSSAALIEDDPSAFAYCNAVGWVFILREGL